MRAFTSGANSELLPWDGATFCSATGVLLDYLRNDAVQRFQYVLSQQRPKLQTLVVGHGRGDAPSEGGDAVVVLDLLQAVPDQVPVVGWGLHP